MCTIPLFFLLTAIMTRKQPQTHLDDVAWHLLDALQTDGRAPLKTLAVSAGLSIAATAERLKRLQDLGPIRAIAADVDAVKAGYPLKAIVGITVTKASKRALIEKLRKAPEVIECHHVAGADSYMMIVVVQSLAELERFLGTINVYGETHTSIVFSTPIERRGIVKPGSLRHS
jgi:Lrp/AsnC family leucine-responsive transcriptional regulator